MKDETLIPLVQCLDVDLKDKSSIDVTVLHETGHLIVMYALGLMDNFSSISVKSSEHKNEVTGTIDSVNGLTDATPDYKVKMQQFAAEIKQVGIPKSGAETTGLIKKIKVNGAALYLPNICKLFGGGAICRFYEVPDEDMCIIDYNHIDLLLSGLGIPGTREAMRILVDMYLNYVFTSFDYLTKAIYINLKQKGSLDKEQVMQIIGEWENYDLNIIE